MLRIKRSKLAYILFIFLALVIILDFIFPGSAYTDRVVKVKKELQQYYNAAGNYHYSHRLFTTNHHFSVSEEFAQRIQERQEILYNVSLIFKEVNGYGLATSESKSIHSLRILSGLIVPLLAGIIMILGYTYESKVGILVFVTQALLLADLLFLMMQIQQRLINER